MKEVVIAKAVWCGPCKSYGPVVESAREEIEKMGYSVRFVDVDDDQDFCHKYDIRGVPTTVVINNEKVSKFSGKVSKVELLDKLMNL